MAEPPIPRVSATDVRHQYRQITPFHHRDEEPNMFET
jgi:hypothetical protein